ncbi:MAG: dihydroorotate dehydrogenase-like protein [Planctomycetes bacterium]|nr:dihydroorotate dehydrogenase-like protein [Planctomycetota bacterium]
MDLSTKFVGINLPHPLLAGASPLADSVTRCQALEAAGIAAIVLRSLFEEQLEAEAMAHHQAEVGHPDSRGEARSYLPAVDSSVFGPEQYLTHLRAVKKSVRVPVIASLNGCSHDGWIDYARAIDAAGADALELNLYAVAADPGESGAELEDRTLRVVHAVRRAVQLPLVIKVSPFYTALTNFALRLEEAGADGIVLFNRFYEPDIDIEAREPRYHLELSESRELGLRLRWLGLLSGHVRGSLAVSGGVHTARDAIKAVLCGAAAVQLVSALLRGGLERIGGLLAELTLWLEENGYHSLQQLRGSMDQSRTPDPGAIERLQYMHSLETYRLPGPVADS